ncbi:MAG: hypothetical protein IT170_17805 [Bryobacterales bacterium]|nr:hypothetical protein [Bryobacterales bacterium]
MTDQLLAAALGGFVAWLLGRCVAIAVRRQRLMSYLTVCLWNHFEDARENQRWLTRVEKDTLQVGRVVDGAPLYSRDELEDLASVRNQCIDLLTQSEMVRLTKCFRSLWEIEVLLEGFCTRLREIQAANQPLEHGAVLHLRKRAERIHALVNLLPGQLHSLRDLPVDYAGRIGARELVPDPPPLATG